MTRHSTISALGTLAILLLGTSRIPAQPGAAASQPPLASPAKTAPETVAQQNTVSPAAKADNANVTTPVGQAGPMTATQADSARHVQPPVELKADSSAPAVTTSPAQPDSTGNVAHQTAASADSSQRPPPSNAAKTDSAGLAAPIQPQPAEASVRAAEALDTTKRSSEPSLPAPAPAPARVGFSDTTIIAGSPAGDSITIESRVPSTRRQKSADAQELMRQIITILPPTIMEQRRVPTVALTLDDVILNLLLFNPMVISARLEWQASCSKALAAMGSYEPSLAAAYKNNSTPRINARLPEESVQWDVGVQGKILSGGTFNVGMSLTDYKHARMYLVDKPRAFTGVTLTQPLLKGAWFGSPVAEVRVADFDKKIAFQNYRIKLMGAIYEAEATYWNLYFSQEKCRFAQESVDIAEKIVTDCKARLRTGKMSEADLLEAEAGLASRQANLADCRQELLEATNRLKVMLSCDEISHESMIHCTTDVFVAVAPSSDTVNLNDSLVAASFTVQPDLLIKRLELEKARVALNYQRNQCLPELNVKGSYGLNGVGNSSAIAWERLTGDPKQTWSSEVELRVPLVASSQARNNLTAERLKMQIARKNLQAVEYELATSIRILNQRALTLRDRIGATKSIVTLRQRLLDVEFQRLEVGKSNYRLIYESEENLTQARQWALESSVRFRIARAELAKISGSLLREKNLETVSKGAAILPDELTRREKAGVRSQDSE